MPRSVQDPLTTSAVTIEGTLNVLLAARDEDVRRVVFASSSSVYGNSGTLPRTESQQPDPISPYAVAKLAAERYCVSFHRVYGLETVALRYFNVFGPRQDPNSQYAAVVPRFIAAIDEGQPVPIHGDGTQSRDFTYVDERRRREPARGRARAASAARVLNVATGRQASVNELADAIGAVLGKPVEKEYLPGPHRRRARLLGRRRRGAKRVLGYEAAVGLEDGLRLTAEAYSRLRLAAELLERRERGLLRARRGEQAGLPAVVHEPPLVAEQEPEEHVDARMPLRDPERLRQVLRLLAPRDAEELVRRVRLVAVLGDPDPLVAVEARHLSDRAGRCFRA